MAKTNFTKAEEALSEALQKMNVEKIYESTEPAKNIDLQKGKLTLSAILRHLKRLQKVDPESYKKLKIKKKKIIDWIENPEAITQEDWETIKQVEVNLVAYWKEKKGPGEASDEKIVEQERIKNINIRFNVNEKWLPLE